MKEIERSLDHVGDITGRRVDFTNGLPLAWGIEIDLPFDSIERDRLAKKIRIKIPENIHTLQFLDLNPQETMPVRLRNISCPGDSWYETNLDLLVATNSISKKAAFTRRKTIEEIFRDTFGKNVKEIDEFNSILSERLGNTILVVEGHSWSVPWTIGEKNKFISFDYKSHKLQKFGNDVSVKDILKKYNYPEKYSAILIYACYYGKRNIKGLDVPLAYGLGKVGTMKAHLGLLPTVVVKPRPHEAD